MLIYPCLVTHKVQLTVAARVDGLPIPEHHRQLVVAAVAPPEVHDRRLAEHLVRQLVVAQPGSVALRTARLPRLVEIVRGRARGLGRPRCPVLHAGGRVDRRVALAQPGG